jgi:protein-tyrosine phosphatase
MDAYRFMEANGIQQWIPAQLTLDAVAYAFERSEMFLVRSEGEVVGTFFLIRSDPILWKGEDPPDAAYLHRLAVDRRRAGEGIGRRILELAEAYVRESKIARLRLDCAGDNARLNEYYRRAGFVYRGRTEGDGWSASLYEKILDSEKSLKSGNEVD